MTILTIVYIVALAVIGGMSVGAHMVIGQVIEAQENTARVVNMSGRQRMLSQRASLFLARLVEQGDDSVLPELEQTIRSFEEAHRILLTGSAASGIPDVLRDSAMAVYFEQPHMLDLRSMDFVSDIRAVMAMPPEARSETAPEYQRVYAQAQSGLLLSLDAAVSAFEQDSARKIDGLVKTQKIVLSIIGLLLVLEGLLIYRPLVNRIHRHSGAMAEVASIDMLTGALNRHMFFKRLETETERSQTDGTSLTLLVFDLDHFKSVNDLYGHDVGDAALRHFAGIARDNLRKEDIFARIGGEEFAVLLPRTAVDDATRVAEKIRRKLEDRPLALPDGADAASLDLTISVGITDYDCGRDATVDALAIRADRALYRAKGQGRNRVAEAA